MILNVRIVRVRSSSSGGSSGSRVSYATYENRRTATRPRSRLHHRNPLRAERALLGIVGRHVELHQRERRHAEVDRAAAAIDDRGRADHFGTRLARDVDRLARRLAGREHVLDDEHAIARREGESAPQPQRCSARSLREDRAHAERARHLVADDETAERRRQHDRRPETLSRARQCPSRAPRPRRDSEARAPTAGSRCCAAPTRGGNAPRDRHRCGDTTRALRFVPYRPRSIRCATVPPVTATVITKNEADAIADALTSLSWADEIIVVDAESTDDTVAIARQFTDRVYVRPGTATSIRRTTPRAWRRTTGFFRSTPTSASPRS